MNAMSDEDDLNPATKEDSELLSSRPPACPGARSKTQPFLESGDPSRFSLFIQRGSASVAEMSRLDLRQNRRGAVPGIRPGGLSQSV